MSKITDRSLAVSVERIRTAKATIQKCVVTLVSVGEPLAKYVGRRMARPVLDHYASTYELGSAGLELITDAAVAAHAALIRRDEGLPSFGDTEAAFKAIGEEPTKRNRRVKKEEESEVN